MKKRTPPSASTSKPSDPILAAWKSQLARAAKKPWLASLLLQRSWLIFRRFAHYYRLLRVLPWRTRRRFLKGAASTLGSLALLLALSGTPSLAANIAVTTNVINPIPGDNQCSLIEATPGNTAAHALFSTSPALDQIPAGINGCGTIFVNFFQPLLDVASHPTGGGSYRLWSGGFGWTI
jgi:hypothetical protein